MIVISFPWFSIGDGLAWKPCYRGGRSASVPLKRNWLNTLNHRPLATRKTGTLGSSKLFSTPTVPPISPPPPPPSSGTIATGDASHQGILYRIPIIGLVFKCIASIIEFIKPSSKATALNLVLSFLLARMWWKYSVPTWIKRNVYSMLPRQWVPAPQTVTGSEKAAPLEDIDAGESGGLFSLPALAGKLGTLLSMAKEQLQSPLEGFALQGALLATLHVMDKKGDAADEWNSYFSSAGDPYPLKDANELLDGLHLSDWAYLSETAELRRYLQGLNFTLVRHVQTDEPGRVGHYVAMDPIEKIAFIVVKGTSELNDMITDACGVPVRYNLTTQYSEGSPSNISCHEGVLTASLDLADDVQPLVEELFVPAGYRIRLIGHSLGAVRSNYDTFRIQLNW